MPVETNVNNRIQELLAEAERLRRGNQYDQALNEDHRQQCAGWLISSHNLINQLVLDKDNPYRKHMDDLLKSGVSITAPKMVGETAAILKGLLVDAEHGLLTSIIDHAAAETFDDFLDNAIAYLDDGKKDQAGVIAGVVFEDSIRRVCRNNKIQEKDVDLDLLITELTRINVLTSIKAKRARAAASVRTKATHAQWDEFDIEDVRACIGFTREFIEGVLGS